MIKNIFRGGIKRVVKKKCSIKKGRFMPCKKLNDWYGCHEGYTYMLAEMVFCPFCGRKIKLG